MENTYVITVTLTKESDRDNLLEMLESWEYGGVGIGDERYYADGDMVYENVDPVEEITVRSKQWI